MKSLELIISMEAESDLEEIWSYIAKDSPKRADNFIDRIHAKCKVIVDMPEVGVERDEILPGVRSFPIGRYLIFYRIKPDHVEIVRILSGYRDIEALF